MACRRLPELRSSPFHHVLDLMMDVGGEDVGGEKEQRYLVIVVPNLYQVPALLYPVALLLLFLSQVYHS